VIDAVRAGLTARANPAKAPDMQAYMKSAMPFLGVQKPARDALARELFGAPLTFDAWQGTVLELWREATYREERYMALALAADRSYREHRTMAALPLFDELIVTGAWWDFVDAVAAGMLGELLDRDDALGPVLRRWATDADMWRRRSAIIAQVRRKQRTDLPLLYDCIEPNRGDREFFIRKAIGWALRSYAWVDPAEIVRYCDTHELSGLSRREALRNVKA
jgi:3-methyladenine DNA glycosylase AlkD